MRNDTMLDFAPLGASGVRPIGPVIVIAFVFDAPQHAEVLQVLRRFGGYPSRSAQCLKAGAGCSVGGHIPAQGAPADAEISGGLGGVHGGGVDQFPDSHGATSAAEVRIMYSL